MIKYDSMKRLITLISAVMFLAATATAQEVKNIIYLIGDGMGLSSVTMMLLEGGYEATIFDEADNVALQKTYSMDNRVTDSAASGTALATGSKTNNTHISVTPDGEPLVSLMDVAEDRGMATGIVVTTIIQHATPAVFYAHTKSRSEYLNITEQLVASRLDVAIGGGMTLFNELYGSPEAAQEAICGAGFNFAQSLETVGECDGEEAVMAIVADLEVGANQGDYLEGATREALRLLDMRGGDEGFVLMVEGSLIDGMGHGNDAVAQQAEIRGFMRAIEAAVEYADSHEDTLVVVTADHETGGLSIVSSDADFTLSEQGVEYRWSTRGHSGVMVPIYLYGAGAELINGIMENAELGAKLKEIIAQR